MPKDDLLTEPQKALKDLDLEEEVDLDDESESEIEDEIDDGLDDDDDAKVEAAENDPVETETEALEELEAEELELLEEEAAEALLVDEVAELRAIQREELTMDLEAQQAQGDEFVCTSCFLVKRTSQLSNRRKKICTDCDS